MKMFADVEFDAATYNLFAVSLHRYAGELSQASVVSFIF